MPSNFAWRSAISFLTVFWICLMSDVVIPHSSLSDALQSAIALKGTLGRNCWVDLKTAELKVDLMVIDEILARDLSSNCPPKPQEPATPTTTDRIDRILLPGPEQAIQLAQIEADYLEEWTKAGDRPQKKAAYARAQQRKRVLRDAIALQYLELDLTPNTLVYTETPEPLDPSLVEMLNFPDGKPRTVRTLIHFSHAASPEELWLREQGIQAERIIRYCIQGIDEGIWERQNQPRQSLDAVGWRKMLGARLRFQTFSY